MKPRLIWPQLFESDDFLKLSHLARLLFIGLFTMADDHGRGKAGDTYLQSRLFPGETIRVDRWRAARAEIDAIPSLRFYNSSSSLWYSFDPDTWIRWQPMRYRKESKIPPPPLLPQISETSHQIPPLTPTLTATATATTTATGTGRAATAPPGFVRFWQTYPSRNGRKAGKRDALKAWKDLKCEPLADEIIRRLETQKEHKRRQETAGTFVPEFPDPHRWLKKRRFNDEITD